MDTKLKADIGESAVLTELLKRGFNVLKPVGDRLPYDLAIDVNGKLIKTKSWSATSKTGNLISFLSTIKDRPEQDYRMINTITSKNPSVLYHSNTKRVNLKDGKISMT